MSAENRLTSIVSYPERGTGGNNRYRGNCSPKLIEDLIGFFKPAEICDYMCGSGTTQDAAHTMGIISHCYDLHSGFDLINCEIPERPEFVFWHPPYWDNGACTKGYPRYERRYLAGCGCGSAGNLPISCFACIHL